MASTDAHRCDLDKLRAAAKAARDLAQECFTAEVTGACWDALDREQKPRPPCLERELKRLKGEPTLPKDSTMRSYSKFDPERLCGSCAAYWWIEMGAQALATLSVQEQQIAAEEERKAHK